jgi:hypothetical protein
MKRLITLLMILGIGNFHTIVWTLQKQQPTAYEIHDEIITALGTFLEANASSNNEVEIKEMTDLFASDKDLAEVLSQELYSAIYYNYQHNLSAYQQDQSIRCALNCAQGKLATGNNAQKFSFQRAALMERLSAQPVLLYSYLHVSVKQFLAEHQQNHSEESFARNFFITLYEQDHGKVSDEISKKKLVADFRVMVNVLVCDSLRLMNRMLDLSPETQAFLVQSEKGKDLAEKLVTKQKIVLSGMTCKAKHTCLKHIQQFMNGFNSILEGRMHLDQPLLKKIADFLQDAKPQAALPEREELEEYPTIFTEDLSESLKQD